MRACRFQAFARGCGLPAFQAGGAAARKERRNCRSRRLRPFAGSRLWRNRPSRQREIDRVMNRRKPTDHYFIIRRSVSCVSRSLWRRPAGHANHRFTHVSCRSGRAVAFVAAARSQRSGAREASSPSPGDGYGLPACGRRSAKNSLCRPVRTRCRPRGAPSACRHSRRRHPTRTYYASHSSSAAAASSVRTECCRLVSRRAVRLSRSPTRTMLSLPVHRRL